ncbi:hypothetical protein BKA69DRAFT_1091790, partial [Paraphysoderma sedebokerense]
QTSLSSLFLINFHLSLKISAFLVIPVLTLSSSAFTVKICATKKPIPLPPDTFPYSGTSPRSSTRTTKVLLPIPKSAKLLSVLNHYICQTSTAGLMSSLLLLISAKMFAVLLRQFKFVLDCKSSSLLNPPKN